MTIIESWSTHLFVKFIFLLLVHFHLHQWDVNLSHQRLHFHLFYKKSKIQAKEEIIWFLIHVTLSKAYVLKLPDVENYNSFLEKTCRIPDKKSVQNMLCQIEDSISFLGDFWLVYMRRSSILLLTCIVNTRMSRLQIGAILLNFAEPYVVWFFFCVSWAPCWMSSQIVWSQPQSHLWARMMVSCQCNTAIRIMTAHWSIHLPLVPHN